MSSREVTAGPRRLTDVIYISRGDPPPLSDPRYAEFAKVPLGVPIEMVGEKADERICLAGARVIVKNNVARVYPRMSVRDYYATSPSQVPTEMDRKAGGVYYKLYGGDGGAMGWVIRRQRELRTLSSAPWRISYDAGEPVLCISLEQIFTDRELQLALGFIRSEMVTLDSMVRSDLQRAIPEVQRRVRQVKGFTATEVVGRHYYKSKRLASRVLMDLASQIELRDILDATIMNPTTVFITIPKEYYSFSVEVAGKVSEVAEMYAIARLLIHIGISDTINLVRIELDMLGIDVIVRGVSAIVDYTPCTGPLPLRSRGYGEPADDPRFGFLTDMLIHVEDHAGQHYGYAFQILANVAVTVSHIAERHEVTHTVGGVADIAMQYADHGLAMFTRAGRVFPYNIAIPESGRSYSVIFPIVQESRRLSGLSFLRRDGVYGIFRLESHVRTDELIGLSGALVVDDTNADIVGILDGIYNGNIRTRLLLHDDVRAVRDMVRSYADTSGPEDWYAMFTQNGLQHAIDSIITATRAMDISGEQVTVLDHKGKHIYCNCGLTPPDNHQVLVRGSYSEVDSVGRADRYEYSERAAVRGEAVVVVMRDEENCPVLLGGLAVERVITSDAAGPTLISVDRELTLLTRSGVVVALSDAAVLGTVAKYDGEKCTLLMFPLPPAESEEFVSNTLVSWFGVPALEPLSDPRFNSTLRAVLQGETTAEIDKLIALGSDYVTVYLSESSNGDHVTRATCRDRIKCKVARYDWGNLAVQLGCTSFKIDGPKLVFFLLGYAIFHKFPTEAHLMLSYFVD